MAANDSRFLDAALLYASLGWPVFPLKPRQKDKFAVKSWKNDATTDESTIKAWWGRNPNYNIGVVTGKGLCVIDVDDKPEKHGGILGSDMLRDWELGHGDIAETVCAESGTGGMHYYYDIGNIVQRKCESPKISIDLRCDGGYIVAPPSIHPDTGLPYTWDISPEDMLPTEAGETEMACIEWVWENRTKNEKKAVAVTGNGTERIREGGRNSTLFSKGRSMRSKGKDYDEIVEYLKMVNQYECVPPLPEDEVEKIATSVCSVEAGFSDEVKNKLAAKRANHVSVAQSLLGNYSTCFLDGTPAVFDGLSYRIGWNEIEKCVLREWPNSKYHERREVLKYLNLTMPHEKQSPPNYIGFANGVLDIDTMELMSFSPDFRIPNVIPHDWNENARSDVLDETLKKIACGDPFIETNLCEFIGLCMYRSGKYAYSAILLGRKVEKASNGKSTYINLLKNVLGKNNFSVLSLSDFGDNFNQQYLSGKLANLGDDISSEFAKGASLEVFKKAVSGEMLHTDVKNAAGYDFEPYCTIVLSANELPNMENLDDGVVRRLFPIRFNAHFSPSDPDFNPEIKDLFKESEEVAEAAIARGIWGLRRVIEQRRPTDNDESRNMVKEIKIDNSNILQWIEDEQCARDDFLEHSVGSAYERYENWCSRSGVRNKFAKWQFSKKMCEHFKFRIKNTSRNGISIRLFAEA